jgi:hypothetical protein
LRRHLTPAALGLLGVLLAILVTVPESLTPGLGSFARPVFVGLAWLVFIAAIPLARRSPARVAIPVILAFAVALPVAAALGPPGSSDDVYRYVWDGRVQAAGIDPYAHPPSSAELLALRDPLLWPPESHWCVAPGATSPQGEPLAAGCTLINRPAVPTIYPPAAQAYFLGVHALSPAGALASPFQIAGALFAIATTLALWLSARSRGADPRSIIAWAWCPAVAIEAGNNAHVDIVAVFLTALALMWARRDGPARASVVGGALLGLAIGTKLTPVLVLPALARRRFGVIVLTVVGVLTVLYAPHVLRVGLDVLGYLPGYLSEEGYTAGSRFALLTLLLEPRWAAPVAVAVLATLALAVARRADPDRPWLGAATMTGAALLLATPSYAWYALLLVLMVGLGARTVWLAVVAAGYPAQYSLLLHVDGTLAQRLGYGAALLAVLGGFAFAALRRRNESASAEPSHPRQQPAS